MNDLRRLNRRIISASSLMDGAYYRWARQASVTAHTLDLLYCLDDGQSHSQKQICEEWGFPKTTVNTIVTALREAGYVTLESMPDQPRQRQICLTGSGSAYARDALEELYAMEDQALSDALERFGPEFIDALEFLSVRFKAVIDQNFLKKEENASI